MTILKQIYNIVGDKPNLTNEINKKQDTVWQIRLLLMIHYCFRMICVHCALLNYDRK
jgi:hypothetical protein